MTVEIKTAFTAVDIEGNHYVVNIWHEHSLLQLAANPADSANDLVCLKTTCGEHLNRLSRGRYQGVQTGVILTSEDTNAP